MAKEHTKFLLTEGKDDVYAIAELMGHHVKWGDSPKTWLVPIEDAGSVTELLNEDYLNGQFKRPDLKAIGIILDANDSFDGRWQRVYQLCKKRFPEIPEKLNPAGLIIDGENGIRLGIWIMPDNQSHGMLETFLRHLVPDNQKLWEHAKDSAQKAKNLDAPYKPTHEDKAYIHTWLAWQDPPGRPFGEALKSKCLDPHSPIATPFVEWFIKLFELEELRIKR